jgi:hypothetical protein
MNTFLVKVYINSDDDSMDFLFTVMLTLPEHLSSPPFLVGFVLLDLYGVRVTRSLVLYVCFVDRSR